MYAFPLSGRGQSPILVTDRLSIRSSGSVMMARREPVPLSPAEWKVMKIVWRRGGCAARDAYEEAGEEYGWATSTVKTILRRLTVKGYVKTKRVGNSFLYRPARPALKSLLTAADTLLENALDGTAGPVLLHMVKKSRLSSEELAQLRALLDRHGKNLKPKS